MDMWRGMDDFQKDDEDSGYSFAEYVSSDEEDVQVYFDSKDDVNSLRTRIVSLEKEVRRLKMENRRLQRDMCHIEQDAPPEVVCVSRPELISTDEEVKGTKFVYELTPGYRSTFYKCRVTGNVTTTTPPSLLRNKEFIDLPDSPLLEPNEPKHWFYTWKSSGGLLHSGSSVVNVTLKHICNRLETIKMKLCRRVKRIEKAKGQVSCDDDPDDDDDDDEDDDDDADDEDDGGSWCSSTYLDHIVVMNDIDFDSLAYIGGCDDPATPEACNRIVRWFNSSRDTMSNVKFLLPKIMSTRFVKFMLALSEINNISLQFPVNSPFIVDHQTLHTDGYWKGKFDTEIQRTTEVLQKMRLQINENKNLRKHHGMLAFNEEFHDKLKSLDLTREAIISKLNQKETKFTAHDLRNFEQGRLSIKKTSALEQLLKDWLKNYKGHAKTESSLSIKGGHKFGYIKGAILSCPHCTWFTHTRQLEIDKHIFQLHEIYPYNCPVCREGFRYPRLVNRHIKKVHSTDA